MSAVAVLDCTTAVTPMPERTAVNRLLTLREMSCRRLAPSLTMRAFTAARRGRTDRRDARSKLQPDPRGKVAAILAPRPRALKRPDRVGVGARDGTVLERIREGEPPARATRCINWLRKSPGGRAPLSLRERPIRGSKRSSSWAMGESWPQPRSLASISLKGSALTGG